MNPIIHQEPKVYFNLVNIFDIDFSGSVSPRGMSKKGHWISYVFCLCICVSLSTLPRK